MTQRWTQRGNDTKITENTLTQIRTRKLEVKTHNTNSMYITDNYHVINSFHERRYKSRPWQ